MVQQRDTRGLKRKNGPILDVEDSKNNITCNNAVRILQQCQEATGEKQTATSPPDLEASTNQQCLPATGQKKIMRTYTGSSTIQGKEVDENLMQHAIDLGSAANGKNVVLGDEISHYGGDHGGQVTAFPNIPSYANVTTNKGKEIMTHENMYVSSSPSPWASGLQVAVSKETGPALQGGPSQTPTSGNGGFGARDPSTALSDHHRGDTFRSNQSHNLPCERSTDTVVPNPVRFSLGFTGQPGLHSHHPEVANTSDHGSNGMRSLLNMEGVLGPNHGPAAAQLGRPVQFGLTGSRGQYRNNLLHQDQLTTGSRYLQPQQTRINLLGGWNHGPATAQLGRPVQWGQYNNSLLHQDQHTIGLQYLQLQPTRMNPLGGLNHGPVTAQVGEPVQWGFPVSWVQYNNSPMHQDQHMTGLQYSQLQPLGGWNHGLAGGARAQLGLPMQWGLPGSGAQYNDSLVHPTRIDALGGWNHGGVVAQLGQSRQWGLSGLSAQYNDRRLGHQEQNITGSQYLLQPQPSRRMNPPPGGSWNVGVQPRSEVASVLPQVQWDVVTSLRRAARVERALAQCDQSPELDDELTVLNLSGEQELRFMPTPSLRR